MAAEGGQTARLLGRERELNEVRTAVMTAAEGEGCALYVTGEAGIGKTSLVHAAIDMARRNGARALAARGTELEEAYSFGVVRQLLEPLRRDVVASALLREAPAPVLRVLEDVSDAHPQQVAPDVEGAVLHALYWFCAHLCDAQPLLLAIDDAHWSDVPSARFLAYLAHRLEGLAIALLVVVRRGEAGATRGPLDTLGDEPTTRVLVPTPLDVPATRELIRDSLGADADPTFGRACQRVSGGNPFLLTELLRVIVDEGLEPTATASARVLQLGSATVAHSVLRRIDRLGAVAIEVARAVAVLGSSVPLHHARALVAKPESSVRVAVDDLVRVGVLARELPLRFVHPLMRASVYEDISPAERSAQHRRAARMLAREGAPHEHVAAHLLATAPMADRWVVRALREAAAAALAKGAPASAARLLRRAVAEPPAPQELAPLLHALGRAALAAQEPDAIAVLHRALELSDTPAQRASVALDLGVAAALAGVPREAIEVLEAAIAELDEEHRDLRLSLEALLVGNAITDRDLVSYGRRRLATLDPDALGKTLGDRRVLVFLAVDAAMRGESAVEALDVAERALSDGRLLAEEAPGSQTAVVLLNVLTVAGAPERAHALFSTMLDEARSRGSVVGFASTSAFRALAGLRLGRLADAEADAETALRLSEGAALRAIRGYAVSQLVEIRLERGRIGDAVDALAAAGPEPQGSASYEAVWVLYARARLRLAQGELRGGLADMLECGRRQEAWGMANPAWMPWASHAALAHFAVGNRGLAIDLASQEVARAERFAAPWSIGVALRAYALMQRPAAAVEPLERARIVLAAATAPLEQARVLVALGATRRRAGQRRAAIEPLRHALELAAGCGAQPLVHEARTELSALGIRPRRSARHGREALTASERRVASLAAGGMTNREIAQALFVTSKTVETHLRHVFDKLEIRSRRELPGKLDPEAGQRAG